MTNLDGKITRGLRSILIDLHVQLPEDRDEMEELYDKLAPNLTRKTNRTVREAYLWNEPTNWKLPTDYFKEQKAKRRVLKFMELEAQRDEATLAQAAMSAGRYGEHGWVVSPEFEEKDREIVALDKKQGSIVKLIMVDGKKNVR